MTTYVLRVWLPDRPGALGQVASRIGAVRGDLIGIEILERGAGRAIDELIVDLPDAGLVDLLVTEVRAVDGVDVEDVRPAPASIGDPRLDALETAARLMGTKTVAELLSSLVQHALLDFGVEWAAVVDPDVPELLYDTGPTPSAGWLSAFISGTRSSAEVSAGESGPDDVAWAPLPSAGVNLVLGRRGRPLRARERRQVAALARIADARWCDVRP